MKYKFIYSLSFFPLYGSVAAYLWTSWLKCFSEGAIVLLTTFLFYLLFRNWIYYAKEWIASAIITLSLVGVSLLFLDPFLAFGLGLCFLGSSFIQVYLDEMCRSKEK